MEFDSEAVEQADESVERAVGAGGGEPGSAAAARRASTRSCKAALDALPEAFREAVWLRDVEELSYQEIAEVLDDPDRHGDVAHFAGPAAAARPAGAAGRRGKVGQSPVGESRCRADEISTYAPERHGDLDRPTARRKPRIRPMTECRRIESLLPPYVDGEATAERRRRRSRPTWRRAPPAAREVAAERTACAWSCARGPRELRTPAPPGLRTRIAASLSRRRAPVARLAGRLTAFGAAAVVIVVLVTALEFVPAAIERAVRRAAGHRPRALLRRRSLGSIDARRRRRRSSRQFAERLRLGRSTCPASSAEVGLTLVAARRCPFWLGDHAHLLYRTGGRDVSLYVTHGTSARRAEQLRVLGHVERIWTANGNAYALVARGVPADELDAIAAYLERESIRGSNRRPGAYTVNLPRPSPAVAITSSDEAQ